MISEEHLKHWISEIMWQLNGIKKEVDPDKVQLKGINVGKTGESFVSFEYLQEKQNTIRGIISCIESDMVTDRQ